MFFYKWAKYANFLVENELVCHENLKNTNDKITKFVGNKIYVEAIIYKINFR